jgi:ABC-type branched-subunit amino acid transport system permease subunit
MYSSGPMTPSGERTQWSLPVVLLIAALGIAVYIPFDIAGMPGTGRVAMAAFGLLVIVTKANWSLRRYWWFWMTIAALVLAHVLLVLLFPWPSVQWIPAPVLIASAIPDLVAVVWVIRFVERQMSSRRTRRESGGTDESAS